MRKASFVIGLCMIFALALNVMDMVGFEDGHLKKSHPDTMKAIGSARASLQKNIQGGDGAAAATDGEKLAKLFNSLVPMYEEKGEFLAPAVEIAKSAASASADAATAAKAGDMDAAMAAHGNIVAGCRGCHGQFREKAPDGSYRFKSPE